MSDKQPIDVLLEEHGPALSEYAQGRGWPEDTFTRLTWETWHSGGGCYALRADLPGGGEALITEQEGVAVPIVGEEVICLGIYAEDMGEQLAFFESRPRLRWQVFDSRSLERLGYVSGELSGDHDETALRITREAERLYPEADGHLMLTRG